MQDSLKLNNLTTKEIQVIIEKAVQYDKNDRKIRV